MRLKFILIAALIMMIPQTEALAQKNKFSGTGIVAHRGFWNCEEAGYAKNSIAALKCAQEAGFWGSEFDVNMTSDSVLLVFHDGKVEGKKIEKHPYEDFKYYRLKNGEPIPTLDQYLEQGKKHPETMLVFELKKHSCHEVEKTFVNMSVAALAGHGLLDPSRVMFISFSKYICEYISSLLSEDFMVQYLGGEFKPLKVKKDGINGIDYNYKILKINKRWVANARSKGMSTNSWTVNKKKDMEAILKMKIDMLTTDQPLEARELMKTMKIKEL